jgi:hypothetical protein
MDTPDTTRRLTLYMVPNGDGQAIVTDHGEFVIGLNISAPDLLGAHALAERTTGAAVKLVTPINTVSRYGTVPLVRTTEDHDDPILARLIRMIHG